MKKVIVGVVSVLASALLMAGCNKQVIDLTYEYNWAQPKMPCPDISRAGFMAWVKDFYKLEKVYTKEETRE